jgi:hypothetical protein
MSAYTIDKPDTDPVIGVLNTFSFNTATTIQNNTDSGLTIEVTNQDVQSLAPGDITWDNPPDGANTIAAGDIGIINTTHVAFRASGTGTGTISVAQG